MKIKSKTTLAALIPLIASSAAFAGPTATPFNKLFLEGEYDNAYPNSQIYANNRMQAEINVIYELNDGYTFVSVDLKRLYDGVALENTIVSNGYNGYVKDIRLGSGTLSSAFSMPKSVSTSIAKKYLSSSSVGTIQVCVEAKARNNTSNNIIIQSTCEGTTNKASVSIEKRSPKTFSLSDFTVNLVDSDWTDDWIIKAQSYRPIGFSLQRVWDENGGTLPASLLNDSGITNAPYKLLASYHPDRPYLPAQSHLRGSSSLYWVSNAQTNKLEFPYFDATNFTEPSNQTGSLIKKHPFYFNVNTNENITFVTTYGGIYTGRYYNSSKNYANMGLYFKEGPGAGGLYDDLEPDGKKVHFEDGSGNRGYFSFSRKDIGDNFGNAYYSLAVNSSN